LYYFSAAEFLKTFRPEYLESEMESEFRFQWGSQKLEPKIRIPNQAHDHYLMPIFCVCPDGTIPIAFFNVPGSVSDNQVAEFRKIYVKLENVFLLTGAKCCINLAFSNMQRDYLYKSCQDVFGSLVATHKERTLDTQKKRQATLLQQTAEWGIICCRLLSHGWRINLCAKREESR
jgi:hypothetical protein